MNWGWAEVPFTYASERWNGELDITFIAAAAVVHDQSWLVVVVEVIEFFKNLPRFHVNKIVVVISQVKPELVGAVLTENAAKEFIECDQVTVGTLLKIKQF